MDDEKENELIAKRGIERDKKYWEYFERRRKSNIKKKEVKDD